MRLSVLRIPLSHWFIRAAFDFYVIGTCMASPPGWVTCWAKTVNVASGAHQPFLSCSAKGRRLGDWF